jgi:hypothetical protein
MMSDRREKDLIKEPDPAVEPSVEQAWIEEAQRRYDAYLKGELKASPGDAVMQRARSALTSDS